MVLGGVLIATAGAQLRDYPDMNVQGLDLLLDNALRHTDSQFLHQRPYTEVLREREGVETHTLPPIEGPKCADRDSETIGDLWDGCQLLSL